MPARDDRASLRLPDFIVIGAAKSGTTSLYRWLGAQPEIRLPSTKEPHFFSRESTWRRGTAWYGGLFATAPESALTGEASASYTDPAVAPTCAERIARTIPDVRLLYVVRHPIERLRSHYRHQVQRARERRPLAEAVSEPGNPYVGHSLYATCLEPYVHRFGNEQICVVRLEDLADPSATAWATVLAHLGLSVRAQPTDVHNASADKPGFTKAMLMLWESRLMRFTGRLPGSVRSAGKAVLLKRGDRYRERIDDSVARLPSEVVETIWADVSRLHELIGEGAPTWPRSPAPVSEAHGA